MNTKRKSLKLISNFSNINYKYFPQTKEELKSLIQQRIKEEGNEVDLNNIDVSAITDMSELFAYNSDFNGDISSWDVSGVTNMAFMFDGCKFFNRDLSGWDVSKVGYNTLMFYNCQIKEEYKPKFK